MKHAGSCIMVWEYISGLDVGPVRKINGMMDISISGYLEVYNVAVAEENMPLRWKFKQDNDQKHTAIIVTQFFKDHKFEVLK